MTLYHSVQKKAMMIDVEPTPPVTTCIYNNGNESACYWCDPRVIKSIDVKPVLDEMDALFADLYAETPFDKLVGAMHGMFMRHLKNQFSAIGYGRSNDTDKENTSPYWSVMNEVPLWNLESLRKHLTHHRSHPVPSLTNQQRVHLEDRLRHVTELRNICIGMMSSPGMNRKRFALILSVFRTSVEEVARMERILGMPAANPHQQQEE
jgi:hypothetical protein